MKLCYTQFSEIGLKRTENQDVVFAGARQDTGLFVLADGMGGHYSGAYASEMVKRWAKAWWNRYDQFEIYPDFRQGLAELEQGLQEVNQTILEHTPKGQICGCTIVLLWIRQNYRAVLSCGDSRCYQISSVFGYKQIKLLTLDDVWENQYTLIQGMTREEIKRHPNYGKLTRALGTEETFSGTLQVKKIRCGTLYLLCSDGVYKYCEDAFFRSCLLKAQKTEQLKENADLIYQEIMKNGAPDNLSMIFVQMKS